MTKSSKKLVPKFCSNDFQKMFNELNSLSTLAKLCDVISLEAMAYFSVIHQKVKI